MAEMTEWQKKLGFKKSDKLLPIYYTPLAFTKTIELVMSNKREIGWNLVVKPYKNGYIVEDAYVYPQVVSPGNIDVDEPTWGLWKDTLPSDAEANLNGHGHSHVRMHAFMSAIDAKQQKEELEKHKGFYFFQIWNQYMEYVSFFYDIENKLYYDETNIDVRIEYPEEFQWKDMLQLSLKEAV